MLGSSEDRAATSERFCLICENCNGFEFSKLRHSAPPLATFEKKQLFMNLLLCLDLPRKEEEAIGGEGRYERQQSRETDRLAPLRITIAEKRLFTWRD